MTASSWPRTVSPTCCCFMSLPLRARGNLSDGDVDRTVNVAARPLVRRPHVNQLHALATSDGIAQLRDGYPFDARDGQPGARPCLESAGDGSFQVVEPHAQQLETCFLRLRRLVREQDERNIRWNHPAGPEPDFRSESDVHCAIRMSRGERITRTKVDDERSIRGERS